MSNRARFIEWGLLPAAKICWVIVWIKYLFRVQLLFLFLGFVPEVLQIRIIKHYRLLMQYWFNHLRTIIVFTVFSVQQNWFMKWTGTIVIIMWEHFDFLYFRFSERIFCFLLLCFSIFHFIDKIPHHFLLMIFLNGQNFWRCWILNVLQNKGKIVVLFHLRCIKVLELWRLYFLLTI